HGVRGQGDLHRLPKGRRAHGPGRVDLAGLGAKKCRPAPAFFMVLASPIYIANTHFTSDLTSSGLALTAGWPFPVEISSMSFASASDLPLYLAALSLNDVPTFLLSAAWQFSQPLFFAISC